MSNETKEKSAYIAGKMRGVPYYNFPAFDKARDRLVGLGLKALSPADMDREAGFDPFMEEFHFRADPTNGIVYDWNTLPKDFDLPAAIERDNKAIDDPDTVAVYVIHEGISESAGGMAEIERAMKRGKIILFDTMSDDEILHALGIAKGTLKGVMDAEVRLPPATGAFAMLTPEQKKDILNGKEVRVVDPSTGAGTSMRLARFDLIPQDVLWEFAELYGRGAVKHGDSNMEGGYPWSWSYQKALRHLSRFWQGETADGETTVLHVLQAAWHCFTLAWFIRHGKGTDDRPKHDLKREAPASN